MYIRSGEIPYDMNDGNTKNEIMQIMQDQKPSYDALWERIEMENPKLKRHDHTDSVDRESLIEKQEAKLERAARASLLHDLGPFGSTLAMQLLDYDIKREFKQVETYKTYVADTDFVGEFTHQKKALPKGEAFEHHTLCLTANHNYLAIPIHHDFAKVQSYGLTGIAFAFTKLSSGEFRVQNVNEPTPDRDSALPGMSKKAKEAADEAKYENEMSEKNLAFSTFTN